MWYCYWAQHTHKLLRSRDLIAVKNIRSSLLTVFTQIKFPKYCSGRHHWYLNNNNMILHCDYLWTWCDQCRLIILQCLIILLEAGWAQTRSNGGSRDCKHRGASAFILVNILSTYFSFFVIYIVCSRLGQSLSSLPRPKQAHTSQVYCPTFQQARPRWAPASWRAGRGESI